MRELQSHKQNGLNEAISIQVIDEPGSGNACHEYLISYLPKPDSEKGVAISIPFQKGPIGEADVNGISNEALLAIVEDRLAGFQTGTFACIENQIALQSVRRAMDALRNRTRSRIARGVEGTSQR